MELRMRLILGIVLLCTTAAAQGQGVNSFGDGEFPGPGVALYPIHAPEHASEDQIRALVAKLGPGVYHRMSDCMPPPRWGTGSNADVAAAHLVKIGAPSLPFVLPLAQTRDEATRALVIEIISRIADRRAVPVLIDTLHNDESARVRVSAAEGLAWRTDPRVAPALEPALRDSDRHVQLFAVHVLARHPQQSAIEPLAALINRAGEHFASRGASLSPAHVAEAAALALGAIGPPAYNRITELLASPNEYVRRAAAIALTECDDRRAIPKLIELCSAPEDMTRLRAARALGRWPEPGSIAVLAKMMREDGGNASAIAAQSLAHMGGEALDPLFAAARDRNPGLRYIASSSFLDIRDRTAASRLVELIQSDDAHVRQEAIGALGHWKDARVIPTLVIMAPDPDMERRRFAIGLLGQYDSAVHPEIIPLLLTAMTDPHEWVRGQAASALLSKKDKRIDPAMKRLLNSPILGVPALAKMVLRRTNQ